jgi:hypothetical protein
MRAMLATGHPWVAGGTGFDVAPLILGIVLLWGMRLGRVRVRAWMVPISMLAGVILDDAAGAFGASTLAVITLILAVSCLVSLGRRGGETLPPTV